MQVHGLQHAAQADSKSQGPWVGGIERRMNWAERETGTGDRKLEKDAEEGRSRGGRAVFMVVEKSSKATVHAGSNTTTEITYKVLVQLIKT